MANDGKLDIDSLEALVTTGSADLKTPETVASVKTIRSRRKARQKKETQKAFSEAREFSSFTAAPPALSEVEGLSSATVEQSTTKQQEDDGYQNEDDGYQNEDDGTNTPTQATLHQASTPTRGTNEDLPAEVHAPMIASTDVQRTVVERAIEDSSVKVPSPITVSKGIQSTKIGYVNEDYSAEVLPFIVSTTDIQPISVEDPNEDFPAVAPAPLTFLTPGQLISIRDTSEDHSVEIPQLLNLSTDVRPKSIQLTSKDLPAQIPANVGGLTDYEQTSSGIGRVESTSGMAITLGDLHVDRPIVRRGSVHSDGFRREAEEFPIKIGYGIDGFGYPAPVPTENGSSGGSKNLSWAYATHTVYDYELKGRGVWLFEKPKGHLKAKTKMSACQSLSVAKAPIILLPAQGPTRSPKKNFDGKNLHITAHGRVRNDVRSLYSHPDFMTVAKLSEYQASEAAGEKVWRHDRDLLSCRMAGCRVQITDSNPANIVCLGCGPKTTVRYCSVQHLIADIKEHWRECGHTDLVMKQVMDHTTEPARFSRLCPALRDRNGFRSYANHRQKVYAEITYGHYTLFDFANESPMTLMWPDNDPVKKEMESRVERTLNLAIFDHTNHLVLIYLYKLLRECLQNKDGWVVGTQHAINTQFQQEFRFDPTTNPNIACEEHLCECEWIGIDELPTQQHLAICKRQTKISGKAKCQPGMREHVEWMEAEYWILRVWRQQHSTARHWRERAVGKDFPDVDLDDDWEPYLGAAWEGYGAEEDRICG